MKGRVLAVDPGSVRVGLAVSDPGRVVAQPLEVIPRDGAVSRIVALCRELAVAEIVVGLPVTESGEEGPMAVGARQLMEELEATSGIPVRPVDERYTTRLAEKAMMEAGVRRRRRRRQVDKVAAALLLRDYLAQPDTLRGDQ